MKKGKLYLIPSPLSDSNVNDYIPTSVRNIVNSLKYFVVEDLRTARRYISKLKIDTPIDELNFSLFNEHTDIKAIFSLLNPVFQGQDLGLLSDAGMPCIADPGEELVRIAHSSGVTVIPLVGPSSIFLALASSGLSGEKFSFEGYLPAKTSDLIKTVRKLEHQSRQENQSKIFIETPYRSAKIFDTILNICSPDTFVCLACNVTSSDEFIQTRQIREWKKNIPDINKKPCIFILQA
ncbi:MAG: SAM-dependent methyltransferase [Prevotellaceae bacterium]|jgi:16S rRNA (cytidine1402-2'-O)-methyltransferase|nr:SAM-dependent methyltransferase [Prevotellaceae bacterium]